MGPLYRTFPTKARAVRPLRKRSDLATCTTNYKLARRHFVVKMGDLSELELRVFVVLSVRGVAGAERGWQHGLLGVYWRGNYVNRRFSLRMRPAPDRSPLPWH